MSEENKKNPNVRGGQKKTHMSEEDKKTTYMSEEDKKTTYITKENTEESMPTDFPNLSSPLNKISLFIC